MPETQPTPGPWLLREFPTGRGSDHRLWVTDALPDGPDDRVICNVIAGPTSCPDWPANARLIAAAPDLLSACQQTLSSLRQHAICSEDVAALNAAIAKALGAPQ